MKNIKILKQLALGILVSICFVSCEEADSEKVYGNALIYMPQSTIFSGGSDNNYPVPSGDVQNPNYSISGDNINIILGVYRAGLQSLEAFSVEVTSNADTAAYIVDNNLIADAELLPEDILSIPSAPVSVASGSRETTFTVAVNGALLNSNYPALAGKKLIVAIRLVNPTRYELNESLATTIVVINADDFMPMPQ